MSELTDDEKDRRVQLEYSRIMFETVRNQRDEAMAEVEKLREKLAWEQESHKRTARMLRAKVQPEITLEMCSRLG
mgnify:CR=1 FL=1